MDRPSLARLQLVGLFLAISLVTGCAESKSANSNNPDTSSPLVTPIASMTSTVEASPTSEPTVISTGPVWDVMENWSPANQIRVMLIDHSGDLWTGGPAGVVHWDLNTNTPTVYAIHGDPENTNVTGLSQTPDGSIWVGTYGYGLARFDGVSWQTITINDGLPGDFITSQIVTPQGELWLVILQERQSIDGAQFGRLNNLSWIRENGGAFDHILALPDESIISTYNYDYASGTGVFISAIKLYDGQQWNDLGASPTGWIDAITIAPNGMIWFTTDDTVYHGTNQSWANINPPWGKEEATPSVSSIAVSDINIAWFGFSFHTNLELDQCGWRWDTHDEYGAYRYDGEEWTHFTIDDGLIDNKICTVVFGTNNDVWFGSYDKGVSRFESEIWTSYVVP